MMIWNRKKSAESNYDLFNAYKRYLIAYSLSFYFGMVLNYIGFIIGDQYYGCKNT